MYDDSYSPQGDVLLTSVLNEEALEAAAKWGGREGGYREGGGREEEEAPFSSN